MRITLLLTGALLAVPAIVGATDIAAADQARLVRLVRQDCGSCHGMRLAGGLGPALTPDALAGRRQESLVAAVLHGRPGTPMPPWSRFVTEHEARWIVEQLTRGFPDER